MVPRLLSGVLSNNNNKGIYVSDSTLLKPWALEARGTSPVCHPSASGSSQGRAGLLQEGSGPGKTAHMTLPAMSSPVLFLPLGELFIVLRPPCPPLQLLYQPSLTIWETQATLLPVLCFLLFLKTGFKTSTFKTPIPLKYFYLRFPPYGVSSNKG